VALTKQGKHECARHNLKDYLNVVDETYDVVTGAILLRVPFELKLVRRQLGR
jgi:hypothetical protein